LSAVASASGSSTLSPATRSALLFMVIEQFKGGEAAPVGERFKECGRMLSEGVHYQSSWVDAAGAR
jgi:hypothetical protein